MKLTTDRHEASRGLFATAELLVKMVATVAQFYFRIGLGDVTFFRRSMSISIPNIVRITQSTGEM